MQATGAGHPIPRRLFSSCANGANAMSQLRSAYLVKASIALVVATVVAATLVAVPLRQAEAQDLSGTPIKLIVGVAAGDAADVTARRVAQRMSEGLRTTVDVENRPGKS